MIDWLTFSIKSAQTPQEVITKYLGLDPALFQEAPYGLMGYQRVPDIQMLHEPRENKYFRDMDVCVSMSGNGCRAFETMSRLTMNGAKDAQGTASAAFPILFQLLAATEDATISRIDIACDGREGHLCMDDIVRKVQDNEINSRMSKRTLYLGYDGIQRSGTTVYIGAESSAKKQSEHSARKIWTVHSLCLFLAVTMNPTISNMGFSFENPRAKCQIKAFNS